MSENEVEYLANKVNKNNPLLFLNSSLAVAYPNYLKSNSLCLSCSSKFYLMSGKLSFIFCIKFALSIFIK